MLRTRGSPYNSAMKINHDPMINMWNNCSVQPTMLTYSFNFHYAHEFGHTNSLIKVNTHLVFLVYNH